MQSKTKFNKNSDNLKKVLNKTNNLDLPKLDKIVISVGTAKIRDKKELIDKVIENLKKITGQKPIITAAKKSIAGFKVREGEKIGVKVTLRKEKMWSFYDKVINTSLPQIRDFQGFKKSSLDNDGNISFGVKEQTIFPEISYDDVNFTHGLLVTITIKSKSKEEAVAYLESINFPFERQ